MKDIILQYSYEIPICIHAHKIALPLLADFPKKRIDINPFIKNNTYFSKINWCELSLSFLIAQFKPKLPLLLFLDSFTVSNLNIIDIEDNNHEIYLFIGDTQHGPKDGFYKLIELASIKSISKIFFVNNPQHAHWFAKTSNDFKKFYFLPIGISNLEKEKSFEGDFLSNTIIHVGNILSNHIYRNSVLTTLKQAGLQIPCLKTVNYKVANYLHYKALASINISLNSDLSFRLFEINISNGLCIADKIGYVQKENAKSFLDFNKIIEFDDVLELCTMLSEHDDIFKKQDIYTKKQNMLYIKLIEFNDIHNMAIQIIEPRISFWKNTNNRTSNYLDRYIELRNMAIACATQPVVLHILSDEDFDFFVCIIDITRIKLLLFCNKDYLELVNKIILMFNLNNISVIDTTRRIF